MTWIPARARHSGSSPGRCRGPARNRCVEVDQTGKFSCAVKLPSGDRRHASTALSKIEQGRPDILLTDLDGQARVESDRARLDLEAANRDLTVFAGRVAHDLKTPLAPIGLLAGGLSSQSIDPKVVRAADRIVASVARVGDMIEGLLTFSRLGRQDAATAASKQTPPTTANSTRPGTK